MIEIKNLCVSVEGKEILKNLSLSMNGGEFHAIMGPNGSGKSTLSYAIAGKEGYEITQGEILMNGRNIIEMEPEERAAEGVFLSFQYPVEIPGVQLSNFIKTSVNSVRKLRGKEEISTIDFLRKIKSVAADLGIKEDMLKRHLNAGFSGGEKKRCEALQMAMLEPSFIIMDEVDSGLDIDALRTVSDAINGFRSEERCFLIITHYKRLLEYVKPDFVHVIANGSIKKSGGTELAHELEETGYAEFAGEVA